MTQNLDLNLVADPEHPLTSDDTDLTFYGSKGYDSNNGYECSNSDPTCTGGTISWTPERSTIPNGSLSGSTWTNDNNNPYSYDNGEKWRDNTVTQQSAGTHGLSGNYYNWTAAIASNASNSFSTSTINNPANNPQNSICPSGWQLPTITNYTAYRTGTNDFYNLDYWYNASKTNTSAGLAAAPLFFVRSGYVYSGSLNYSGSLAYFWSSTFLLFVLRVPPVLQFVLR